MYKGYSYARIMEKTLVKLFFHSFKDGKIQHQGVVTKKLDNGYRVLLFDFLIGNPSEEMDVTTKEMKDWNFYKTSKEMRYFHSKEDGLDDDEFLENEEIRAKM